jgi:hypothetical protein
VGSDRFGRPDVRGQFVSEDGAAILLHYSAPSLDSPDRLRSSMRSIECYD